MTKGGTESATDTAPVVIVGSGPIGMVLALDLARYGVATILVDRQLRPRASPKGNTHNARTMEHYRRLGLAEDIRKLGLPPGQDTDVTAQTRLDGFELGRISLPSTETRLKARDRKEPTGQYPEPMHRANQMFVEAYLHEQVRACGQVSTLSGWEYVGADQSAEDVQVRLRNTQDQHERVLTVDYLIGCDGGRSAVRKDLGILLEGEDSFDAGFMGGSMRASHLRIPGFYDRFKRPRGWQYFILNGQFMGTLIDLNGRDEFQLHSPLAQTPTEDDVVKLARSFFRVPVQVHLLSSGIWAAGRALVADNYGHGRIWLAGDSAHIFTPTGGIGMNTGIDDAANLAWKLAAVVQGWGGPSLVDSYEIERRPVGTRNTMWARGNARRLSTILRPPELEDASPEGQAARGAITEIFQSIKDEFGADGIQLGARYPASPIVAREPDAGPIEDDPASYVPTSVPGGRAPHLWLADRQSLYDLIDHAFLLIRSAPSPDADMLAARASERGIPLRLVDIRMAEAATLYPRTMTLLRPDHIVAWRGDSIPDADVLLDLVCGWAAAPAPRRQAAEVVERQASHA